VRPSPWKFPLLEPLVLPKQLPMISGRSASSW
jgi:hypothetical protein